MTTALASAAVVLMTNDEARERARGMTEAERLRAGIALSGKPLMTREEALACAAKIKFGLAVQPRRSHQSGGRTNGATDVYRFYDADGRLLYVGLSCRLGTRIGQHRNSQQWWPQVQRIEVEHLPSRDAAAARERELISALAPEFNRNGGGA